MVNYTTQNAQKLTILIPRAFGARLPPPRYYHLPTPMCYLS